MAKYIIDGKHKLKGTIRVNGSKNAALPMLAATLLTDEPCVIQRVPMIRDVEVMLDILRHLGAVVEIHDHTVSIQTAKLVDTKIPDPLAIKLRASILLLGPILARAKSITMHHPGGCVIGRRPVGTHFDGLAALGIDFRQDDNHYFGNVKALHGTRMFLDEVSVTATENILMASVLADGTTVIEPAACEPHVISLGNMLIAMGAKIEGLGTHTITVHGVSKLKGVTAAVNADEIETGTLAVAFGITHGDGVIEGVEPHNLGSIRHKLHQFGILTEIKGTDMHVHAKPTFAAHNLQIDTWPRLPTDLQPQLTVLATQSEGTTLVHDWMYDRRLLYIDELSKMGAQVLLCDPHRAQVTGPTPLKGQTIISPDLRAGMAFLLAGLIADGTTTIEQAHLIERGYENIHTRLNALGAHIERIDV